MSWHEGGNALIISLVILSGLGALPQDNFLRLLSCTSWKTNIIY